VSVTQAIGGVAVLVAAVVIARSQGTTIEPFAPVGG
jgi:hypothetical protein